MILARRTTQFEKGREILCILQNVRAQYYDTDTQSDNASFLVMTKNENHVSATYGYIEHFGLKINYSLKKSDCIAPSRTLKGFTHKCSALISKTLVFTNTRAQRPMRSVNFQNGTSGSQHFASASRVATMAATSKCLL